MKRDSSIRHSGARRRREVCYCAKADKLIVAPLCHPVRTGGLPVLGSADDEPY